MIKLGMFANDIENIADIKNYLRYYANKNETIIKEKVYYEINILTQEENLDVCLIDFKDYLCSKDILDDWQINTNINFIFATSDIRDIIEIIQNYPAEYCMLKPIEENSLVKILDNLVKQKTLQLNHKLEENEQLYSKLLDHVYPDYTKVIPSSLSETVDVDRVMLLSALERVNVMLKDNSVAVSLTFDSNELIISSGKSVVGEARDVVPIKYDGPNIEISFNPGYLIDPLKSIDEDIITICMSDGTAPAIIKCSIPFLYVIMPLRV
jgi:DNA polymerase III sliding clamp (beta) subunit (PCNA family)